MVEDKKQWHRNKNNKKSDNGDYLNQKQYMVVAVCLGITHILMEFMYIWLGVTPMIYINILSFLCYVFSAVLISKGKHLITVWIMESEIFFHVIFACMFLGFKCGFQLWLYGTFSSLFLPFFIPNLSKKPKVQIGIFALSIIVCFEILVYLDQHDMFPVQYRVADSVSSVLYYINALLAFGSIMIYTSIYNQTMSLKNKQMQYLAEHDDLTGVYSRKKINNILEAEVEKNKNGSRENLAIAILDIDFFKKINDNYGHRAGDVVLKGVTDCFKSYHEKGILYGRWGGEEFLFIYPEANSYDEFVKMLDDLRNDIQNSDFACDGQTMKVTASIGAAAYERGMSADKLIQNADDRLYVAKESGRNRVVHS